MPNIPTKLLRQFSVRFGAMTAIFCFWTATAIVASRADDGYLQSGNGARSKALAGAGVAAASDATAASLNPAGLVGVGNEVSASLSLLYAARGYTESGVPGLVATGPHASGNVWSTIPNFAINHRVDWGAIDAIALTVYRNGSFNADYADTPNPNCPAGLSGISCGGRFGASLQQTIFSVAFAKALSPNLSVGVAPILARQSFSLDGVGLFSSQSTNPGQFSDLGKDETWGTGVRAGVQWALLPNLKVGIAGSSRISMGRNDWYQGALAGQSRLDIPATAQAGISYEFAHGLTVMADAKRIWFGSIPALADSSTAPSMYGTLNGPGFGMKSVDDFKFGVEWRASPSLTWRAGFSTGTKAIPENEADINILTGGPAGQHITGGLKYGLTPNLELEFAAMYAPRTTYSGPELGNPLSTIQIYHSESEFTAGIVYKFDRADGVTPLK